MSDYVIMHHGIKGMKWGIRRYQNKDGTLTAAGKKRYNKEVEKLKNERKTLNNQKRTQAKLDKLDEMRKENERLRNEASGKKKGSSSDDSNQKSNESQSSQSRTRSIQDETQALRTRNDYLAEQKRQIELQRDLKNLTQPQQVSNGKKITEKVIDNVVIPAMAKGAQGLLQIGLKELGANLDESRKYRNRARDNDDDEPTKSDDDSSASTDSRTTPSARESFRAMGRALLGQNSPRTRTSGEPIFDAYVNSPGSSKTDTSPIDAEFTVKSEERTYREQQTTGRNYVAGLIGTIDRRRSRD